MSDNQIDSPVDPEISVGVGLQADDGVVIGYMPQGQSGPPRLDLGAGARLRSGTIIYAGTTIGKHFETGHNTLIRERNTVGDDVSIWSNAVVDYGCTIGNRVKIHCNVYIPQFTTIEDDVFIAPGCCFANDRYPGCPRSKEEMQGPHIEAGAQIGVNVTILPGVRIGAKSLIGSGSVVTRDIPPDSVAWGNPAKVRGTIREIECCSGSRACPYNEIPTKK